MKQQIKIQKLEMFNRHLVCVGKLSCGDVSSFSKLMDIEELRDKLRPVLISETEEIVAGDYTYLADDKELSFKPISKEHLEAANELSLKVLVLPENFSPGQLQHIADGKLKDGDNVYIVCRHLGGTGSGYTIKLVDNYITIFQIK